MSMITIIGRGHSGTRAMSQTLSESGVFMGAETNTSGDLIPPEEMYEACRIFGKFVKWKGGLEWDWSALYSMPVDPEFERLIRSYLKSVLENPSPRKGWKIPETTLVFPWITRLFPDLHYIFWIRHPIDSILGDHVTDDLRAFNIDYPETDDPIKRRAISWKYQYDLVRNAPRPEHWIEVRFEDFVLYQDDTLERIGDFLGLKLEKIPVSTAPVGRWKEVENPPVFDFLEPAMREYGYEIPGPEGSSSNVRSS